MTVKHFNTPTVVHIIYRLDIGGLETVLVEFINRCPPDLYRHVIVCLTNATSFRNRIKNRNVEIFECHKKGGKDFSVFFRILHKLYKLKPVVVHTYNISSLEYQLAALIALVPVRIHAEHGRDNSDIYGENKKYKFLRRIINFAVHYWVPVSRDLECWLLDVIQIAPSKVKLIHNGIDTEAFSPVPREKNECFVIGTIGRLDPVKDHEILIVSFSQIVQKYKKDKRRFKLQIIGEGPERSTLEQLVEKLDLKNSVELLGAKNNISEFLNSFDVFVLSSKAEGIPMTVLEACACQRPIVATDVGGLSEILGTNDDLGTLVAPQNPEKLADAICKYIDDSELAMQHGVRGRECVVEHFSLDKMTTNYLKLYATN